VMHCKFRARDAGEYIDSLHAFADEVVPLVDEG